MGWIQSKVKAMPLKNFTKDWGSGKAVGALVDACAPGLCPDWDIWEPADGLKNATEAMGLADDWLNVRQLIRPEDMINPKIDEQSMMTYLSQYPNAQLKPNAPLRPKTDPKRYSLRVGVVDWGMGGDMLGGMHHTKVLSKCKSSTIDYDFTFSFGCCADDDGFCMAQCCATEVSSTCYTQPLIVVCPSDSFRFAV